VTNLNTGSILKDFLLHRKCQNSIAKTNLVIVVGVKITFVLRILTLPADSLGECYVI
jgi:hypothetical protein